VSAPAVHDLALFASAALLVNLTPGPDRLFVAGSSLAHGRRAGGLAALGVGAGCLVHVALAALGLAALLAASPVAFTVVTWIGAAYLVWMGLAMLRRRAVAAGPLPTLPAARVFRQGAVTNVLNPKVALFFLAFLPQFIDPGAPHQALGLVALGLLFTLSGTAVNLAVALLAGGLRGVLGGGHAAGTWLNRVAGLVFVGLGLRLALAPR
jgi:threonine/homoserine/homoserine lactone efflux protein